MKVGFVYILRSLSHDRYYIGSSGDVEKRLLQHNQGKTLSTRNKGPWEAAFKEQYETLSKARNIEYKIKKLKNRKIIETIIAEGYIRLGKID